MKLLKPVLKKLHVNSLAVPNSVVCLKPRSFLNRNNAEFKNASFLASLLMYSALFTLSGMILLALLTSNNFVQFVCAKIPRESAWESCLDPLGVGCFSGNCSPFGLWTSDIWELATSCKKFLFIISYLCLVFCTQKCVEGCTV